MSDEVRPTGDPGMTQPSSRRVPRAARIGPYRILQKLGEGGMGEVYLAEQEEPVRRRVALKVIKVGMDTKNVVARFAAERQALALMNHPNIARVFDAGTTDRGRPYFAMEYVKGEPIHPYCDKHRLSTRQRLALFVQVCEGIQHAHQKAVIHRDIKSSNVLVTIQDDRPVPKIIDFGVAKATEHRLTEQTVYTELGVLIGTPEYMSPEQAEMSGLDIDTRTDIYSLGVLLYGLLVGALPFDTKELRKAGFDEIRRRIREEEPPKPSTRLSSPGDATREAARRRGTDPSALRRQLSGDLDWITLKAMEKDRTRRYGSSAELAADIRRHLRHEPVTASPPSMAYRARKFARRHRIGVALAASAVLLLAGFAARERIQATKIANEAATARQISDFLVGLFNVSDPSEALGNTITAREILDRGAEEIAENLADQPVVQARLMLTMGEVYGSLGLYRKATLLLERALRIREGLSMRDDVGFSHNLDALAQLYRVQGRYDEAEVLYHRSLEVLERIRGPEDMLLTTPLNNLAVVYKVQGRHDEALPLYERAISIREKEYGPAHRELVGPLNNLARLQQARGKEQQAEGLFRRALEIAEHNYGEEHPTTAFVLTNLAGSYMAQRRYSEAKPLCSRAVAIQQKLLGPDHADLASSLNNLAVIEKRLGNYEEAERLFRRSLAIRKRAFGEEHPSVASSLHNLAKLYQAQSRFAEAEPLYRSALAIKEKTLGNDHASFAKSLAALGTCHQEQGTLAEAEPLLLDALEIERRIRGEDHRQTLVLLYRLARIAAALGEEARALDYLAQAVDRGWAEEDIFDEADLKPLHGRPEFEAILVEVRKRIGED